jgi:hypothetical protein
MDRDDYMLVWERVRMSTEEPGRWTVWVASPYVAEVFTSVSNTKTGTKNRAISFCPLCCGFV